MSAASFSLERLDNKTRKHALKELRNAVLGLAETE